MNLSREKHSHGKLPLVVVTAALLLLNACAASTEDNDGPRLPTDAEVEQYNATVPPDERIVCRNETPVGSNIPRRVCRLVRDVAETSTFHREQLRRVLQ